MEVLLVAAVVGIPLLVVLVLAVRRAAANAEQTLEAAWSEFAHARKFLFHQSDPRLFSPQPIRVTGSVEDVGFQLETVRKQDGDGSRSFTRLTATPTTPIPFDGQIYNELPLAGLARALGAQDVETGDATFDGRFTVKTNNEHAMREHLSTEVREALLGAGHAVFVEFEGGRVILDWRGHETDAAKLDAAIKLVLTLAQPPEDAPPREAESAPARRPSRRRRRDPE